MKLKTIDFDEKQAIEELRKTPHYLVTHSKSTDFTVKLIKKQTIDETFTILRLFEHIGELRLFEFILHKVVKNEGLIYYHNKDTIEQFKKTWELGDSTLHNYLKLMVNKQILIKISNGRYRVNDRFVSVTGKNEQ